MGNNLEDNMIIYLIYFTFFIIALSQIKLSVRYLHIMQLEGYKSNQYVGWIRKNTDKVYRVEQLLVLLLILIALVLNFFISTDKALVIFLFSIIFYSVYDLVKTENLSQKKKIVFTRRLIRLFITFIAIMSCENFLFYKLMFAYEGYNSSLVTSLLGVAILLFITPFNVLLANLLNAPIEYLSHFRYKILARRKIKSKNGLKIIGITGSFGKTSTKHFVSTIISEKYNVLMTPESYNTPMGTCKTIREGLKDNHEVFISEMGARYPGDIKEICNIVRPQIGIITSIGDQHLETFKTIENIAKTKFELIDSLPNDGTAVLNGDDEQCVKLAKAYENETIFYGIENKNVDFYATDITFSSQGTSFVINGKNGIKIPCTTKLLGKHNIYNILAAVCVAVKLELTEEQIKAGIQKIEPVEHRLQIVPTNNGITVIDDAFNSNPVGSSMALEVIKGFPGNKVIITPGMVELGEKEYDYNKEFGVNIANSCDYVILVGFKRTKPIVEGLKQVNFPEDKIIVVSGLNEATQKLISVAKAGDVVLFENDLPDNYNE